MRLLLSFFRPLASIAKDIRIMRELYELELSERAHPIIRQTEQAKKTDTEVLYSGVTDERPKHKRWLQSEDDD